MLRRLFHKLTSPRSRLPDFFIIGAMKAATTSLYLYLEHHPQIHVSHPKEPAYFIDGRDRDRGLDWYKSLFVTRCRLAGEASTSYSKATRFPEVPKRLREAVPEARLIYILRDPLERIVSHYLHCLREGWEKRPFEEALYHDGPPRLYVDASRYAFQLERYLEYFPMEQILILETERLAEEPGKTLDETCRFLGLKNKIPQEALGVRYNTTRSRMPKTERPEISPALRRHLSDQLAPDIARLRALTGKPFQSWSL